MTTKNSADLRWMRKIDQPQHAPRLRWASAHQGTFNEGRNAEKRTNWRASVIDRMARRRLGAL